MKIRRHFTVEGKDPLKNIEFKWRVIKLYGVTKPLKIYAPKNWSDSAVEIAARKYLRRNLRPYKSGPERSIRDLIHRLAYAWMKAGQKLKIFTSARDGKAFYDEILYLLATQRMAPNSPQWFNTGLAEVYGIKGRPSGHYALNWRSQKVESTKTAYERPQAHACFIQSVSNRLIGANGLMDLLTKEARLFKYGSGSGTNFSNISERGGALEGGGESSGVLSFLKVSDRSAGSIKSGGTTRRAAKMVILDSHHPDILEFIRWKSQQELMVSAAVCGGVHLKALEQWSEDFLAKKVTREEFYQRGKEHFIPLTLLKSVEQRVEQGESFKAPIIRSHYEGEAYEQATGQNANHSVRFSDAFFKALESEKQWTLRCPRTKKAHSHIPATKLWDELVDASWSCADPGLMFQDTINKWHTCLADEEIKASNPCGEYLFIDDTACNLASLNLLKFVDVENKAFLQEDFTQAITLTTIMLDISVSLASYPSKTIAERSLSYRTLGLGLTNMATTLMRLGLPYDSEAGRQILGALTSYLSATSWKVSAELAKASSPFSAFKRNKKGLLSVLKRHKRAAKILDKKRNSDHFCMPNTAALWDEAITSVQQFGARNAQVSLIAPTGTISLLMDCDTTGIEPEFSLIKRKFFSGGGEQVYFNSQFLSLLEMWGLDESEREEVVEQLKREGGVRHLPHLRKFQKQVLATSREITPLAHLQMMAEVQPFLSGGISKTINLPFDCTKEELSHVYLAAHKLGLKSIAVYRDGSKLSEPLVVDSKALESTQYCPLCRSTLYTIVGRCFLCLNCGQTSSCS